MAKGVRKTKSRFGGRLEPTSHVDAAALRGPRRARHRVPGRDASTTSGRSATTSTGWAGRCRCSRPPTSWPWSAQANPGSTRCSSGRCAPWPTQDAPLVVPGFFLKALALEGFRPQVEVCVACGTDGPLVSWAMEEGGLRCAAHRQGPAVSPEAVVVLQDILGGRLGTALNEHPAPGGVRGRPPGRAGGRAPPRAAAALGRHPRPRVTGPDPGSASERPPLLGGVVPAEPLAPLRLPHDVGAAGGVPLRVVARRGLPGRGGRRRGRGRLLRAGRCPVRRVVDGVAGPAGAAAARRVGDGARVARAELAPAGPGGRARGETARPAGQSRWLRAGRRRRPVRPTAARPATARAAGGAGREAAGGPAAVAPDAGAPGGGPEGVAAGAPVGGLGRWTVGGPAGVLGPVAPGGGKPPEGGPPHGACGWAGAPQVGGPDPPGGVPHGAPGRPTDRYGAGGRGRQARHDRRDRCAALSTTNVLAAMSPTRRCPFVVRPVMNPTSGKHQGAASTIHSSVRPSARPNPGLAALLVDDLHAEHGLARREPRGALQRGVEADERQPRRRACTGDVTAGGEVDAIAELEAAEHVVVGVAHRRSTRRRRCRAPRSTAASGLSGVGPTNAITKTYSSEVDQRTRRCGAPSRPSGRRSSPRGVPGTQPGTGRRSRRSFYHRNRTPDASAGAATCRRCRQDRFGTAHRAPYTGRPCPRPPPPTPRCSTRSSTCASAGASCSRRPRSTAASARPTTTGRSACCCCAT